MPRGREIAHIIIIRMSPVNSPEYSSMAMERFDIQGASKLSSRLEDEFACLNSLASQGVWYINSGVSTHMIGVKEYFSSNNKE